MIQTQCTCVSVLLCLLCVCVCAVHAVCAVQEQAQVLHSRGDQATQGESKGRPHTMPHDSTQSITALHHAWSPHCSAPDQILRTEHHTISHCHGTACFLNPQSAVLSTADTSNRAGRSILGLVGPYFVFTYSACKHYCATILIIPLPIHMHSWVDTHITTKEMGHFHHPYMYTCTEM